MKPYPDHRSQPTLLVSHAPYLHCGSSVSRKHLHIFLACLPAALAGCLTYGTSAVGVLTLAIGSAIGWELLFNLISKRRIAIGDGVSAVIGLLLGMMMPAVIPWWAVLCGTFLAVIVGREIYGGLGANPFNPPVLALAILMLSWEPLFDFNGALAAFSLPFDPAYPLSLSKSLGAEAVSSFSSTGLLFGRQTGGIGSTFGLGLLAGGLYLMVRGYIRWEIPISFLAGIWAAAVLFQIYDPDFYAGPGFHLLTGYSLLGAFFLASEDASSPVNQGAMLLYGLLGGMLTVLIRNLGIHLDGVIYAILLINLLNPLLDKISFKKLALRWRHE